MSTSCGSPCYAAPELVVSEGLYVGPAVDVWSCGVILYAMLAGYLPFDDDPKNPDGDNINQLYKYILSTSLVFPDYVTSTARDLLRKILVPDPKRRATLEQIKQHPWLAPCRHIFEEDESLKASTGAGGALPSASSAGAGSAALQHHESSSAPKSSRQTKRHTIQLEYEKLPVSFSEVPTPSSSGAPQSSDSVDSRAVPEMVNGNGSTGTLAVPTSSPKKRTHTISGDGKDETMGAIESKHEHTSGRRCVSVTDSAQARLAALSKLEGSVAGRSSSSAYVANNVDKPSHSTRVTEFTHPDRVRPTSMFEGSMENSIAAVVNNKDSKDSEKQNAAMTTRSPLSQIVPSGNASENTSSQNPRPIAQSSASTTAPASRRESGKENLQGLPRPDGTSLDETTGRPSIVLDSTQAAKVRDSHIDGGKFKPRTSLSINRRNVLSRSNTPRPVPNVASAATGEELGFSVGAGISSSAPKGSQNVKSIDNAASGGSAKRMVAWIAKRTLKRQQEVHFGRFEKPPSWVESQFPYSTPYQREEPEVLHHMRVHRGVIDPSGLTSLAPGELFQHVLQTLDDLGFLIAKTQELRIRVHRPALSALGNANKESISIAPQEPTGAPQSSSQSIGDDTATHSLSTRASPKISPEPSNSRIQQSLPNIASSPPLPKKGDTSNSNTAAISPEKKAIPKDRSPVESPPLVKPGQALTRGRSSSRRPKITSKFGAFKRLLGLGHSNRSQTNSAVSSSQSTTQKDSPSEVDTSINAPSEDKDDTKDSIADSGVETGDSLDAHMENKRRVVSGSFAQYASQTTRDSMNDGVMLPPQKSGTTPRRNTVHSRGPLPSTMANVSSAAAAAAADVAATASSSALLPSVPEDGTMNICDTQSNKTSIRGFSPSSVRPMTAGSSFSATSSMSPPELALEKARPRMSVSPDDTSNALRANLNSGKIPPYGEPNVDNGDEVQFIIEICKVKNLPGLFIVHLSRRKGNAWAFKYLYHLIMEKLDLRSKGHYLANTPAGNPAAVSAVSGFGNPGFASPIITYPPPLPVPGSPSTRPNTNIIHQGFIIQPIYPGISASSIMAIPAATMPYGQPPTTIDSVINPQGPTPNELKHGSKDSGYVADSSIASAS